MSTLRFRTVFRALLSSLCACGPLAAQSVIPLASSTSTSSPRTTQSDEQVNTYTTSFQDRPAIAARSDGDFVVAWESTQEGTDAGIYAQRFAPLATIDVDGAGVTGPLTDGLLMLRFLFGFTGPTLTNGAVGPGCTRCDAGAIAANLEGLA